MILVTGGAGYIGSVLVRDLVANGRPVRVLDTCYFGMKSMEDIRDKIDLRVKDVRLADETDLDGVTGVVHLAGFSNDPTAEFWPALTRRVNVIGTRHLAQLCIDCGVRRFVFASTASMYDHGQLEPLEKEAHEEDEVAPTATYAVSKLQAEQELLRLHERHPDFCPVILRKGTVYGWSPRMRLDLVVNTMVANALRDGVITVYGDGTIWRPMVSVWDAAAAYWQMVEAEEEAVAGQMFNIVEQNYQVKEIAAAVWFAAGRSVLIRFQEAVKLRNYRVNAERFKLLFGWAPQETVASQALKLVQFFDKHPALLNGIEAVRARNIDWMRFRQEMDEELRTMRGVV